MIDIIKIVIIILGLLIVVATIKEKSNKKNEDRYNKTKFFINLFKGVYSIVIGSLAILNIVSESRFINLMILLCVFGLFVDWKFKDQANN
ncbi:MAG: hypothetical protein RR539_08430 [Clostridium sp.]|uniref:hypothetical protein n=1 Tax=Clostridium sp. TaxID=1506 RepID=UPI002FC5EC14